MSDIQKFTQAVLGQTAADVLYKAGERSVALGSVLGPRVVVGWLEVIGRNDYDGSIPGQPGSILKFSKNQGLYDGTLTIGGSVYGFSNATLTHLAATLSVALGVNQPVSKALKDSDLVGLGRSIDLLVRARVLQLSKKEPCCKNACVDCGGCEEHSETKGHGAGCKLWKEETGGQQCGAAAAPRGPKPPEGPEPQKKAPVQARPPKMQTLSITKAQSEQKCSVCQAASFRRGEFAGCYCLRDLAKSAASVPQGDGFQVTFGPEWTESNLKVLMDIMGGV